MSEGFSIDLTVPGNREAVALISAESALSLEISTGMKMSRGFSALKAAKNWGFTTRGTKHGALLDCVGLRRVFDPNYEPNERTTVSALVKHFGEERAAKEIATALRRGDQFRALVTAPGAQESNLFWRGVQYAY